MNMTNPHTVAWNAIKDEMLGEVCEVARRVPWGFKADYPSIHNVTCDQFLETDKVFGTVILHILIGEGESLDIFEKVFQHAYKHALKVIVLEHSPSSSDWARNDNVTEERIDFLQNLLDESGERIRTKDLGRNVVHLFTTVKPLFIDQINDNYIKENLNKSWKGTKKAAWYSDGYYTHTSESLISQEIIDKLPVDKDFYWVIGGLMFLGNINNIPDHRHKLIDSVFKQCLMARIVIDPESDELISKINTIQENLGSGILSKINSAPVYIDAFGNKNHWCNFHKIHGCEDVLYKISSIEHLNISDLKTSDQIIYTSTVPLPAYKHLKFKNWVITCTEGIKWDVPWLMEKVEEGYSSPLRKKPADLWNEQRWQRWNKDKRRGRGQIPDYTAAKKFIQSGNDVLDLGCGLGRSGQYAYSEDVKSFTSTDVNSEVLKYVPKYGDNHHVVTGLDESKKYDVVLCMDVLEHVEHDVSFLKKIDSLSKNTIVITTPNFNYSKCRNRYHCREYRPDFFERLIRETIPAEEYIFDTNGAKMTATILKKEKPTTVHVPKKIFFYWGNDTMSWLRYMTLYSFRKFNPDWEMELHVSHIDIKNKYWKTPEAQDFHSYAGKNWLSEVEKLGVTIKECPVFVEGAGPSHNSNFFKWNELATSGGIYSDMDILFIKPIEEYYNNIKDLKTGISYSTEVAHRSHGGYYSIGFMFSSGNNRFFKDVFNFSTERYDFNSYQGAGVDRLYEMLEKNRLGMKPYHKGLCYIPMNLVYPWRHYQQGDFFNHCHTTLPEETIGIHWFAGHPKAQEFNNAINPDTLDNHNNTMSHWLEKIIGRYQL